MSRPATLTYPDSAAERDLWIVTRRGARAQVSANLPFAFHIEQERLHTGEIGSVASIFLTNRECPWRCAMCDLWRHTLTEPTPAGAIPAQIEHALSRLPPARQVKLYNSGSFFDASAIPPQDYTQIAALVSGFERVIVESHPALIGDRCFAFQRLVRGQLEVAMGLETAHPEVLAKLNKRMTLEQYAAAAERLRSRGVGLRSFVLVQPPFMRSDESLHWSCRSLDFAFECGATAVTLIPTRAGNGAVDELAEVGLFRPPSLSVVEDALDYGISLRRGGVGLRRGRVFVDLWDIARVAQDRCCGMERVARLEQMNLSQEMMSRVDCARCGDVARCQGLI